MARFYEVIPMDTRKHANSLTCWCHPLIESADPVTGESYPDNAHIIIHRAADEIAAEAS